jgi:hypothetical protein
MAFKRDEQYAAQMGNVYGEYLTTYLSEPTGQIRADIFRKRTRVDAHVSFPGGVGPADVTELYVKPLWEYAEKEGFTDRFHLIRSEWW